MIKIAHRGASGYEPENTISAFKKAAELKADMLEMDVFRCKTGEPVIIHDNTVDRTTNGKGYIWDLTYKELKSLNAGNGQKIPSLEEALDSVCGIKINLELKGEGTALPVFKTIEKYVSAKNYNFEDFYISSFNQYLLREFIELAPENAGMHISPVILGIPLRLAEFAEELNAYSLNLSTEFINREIVDDAHRRGMKVFAYVINNSIEYNRVKGLGIDGIFTDYPDMQF